VPEGEPTGKTTGLAKQKALARTLEKKKRYIIALGRRGGQLRGTTKLS